MRYLKTVDVEPENNLSNCMRGEQTVRLADLALAPVTEERKLN